MRSKHTWSRPASEAAQVLGLEVARARRERRWTATELAERAGITAVTLRKVERGDPTVSLGTVFEVATLVGVRLFGVERSALADLVERGRDRLALLPVSVREPAGSIHDDF
ncbi:MAG: helix-turn-helix transcriptional regulator [Ilumatobacteraceae bacterium]